MNSSLPEWSKRFINWLNRLPRWMVVAGGIVFLVIGALLLMDTRSTANSEGDPFLNSTTLALGVFVRLILVVIAIFLAMTLVRRWQNQVGRRPDRQLALLETLHLSQRRSVHLVRAGEQVFLIGATDQGISLLGQIPAQPTGPDSSQPAAPAISFDDHLSLANQRQSDITGPQ